LSFLFCDSNKKSLKGVRESGGRWSHRSEPCPPYAVV